MKNLILIASVVATAVATANAQNIISWQDNNGGTIPITGTAGIAPAINWNNSNPTGNGQGMGNLLDNSGAVTTAGFAFTAGVIGTWGIAGVTSPDTDGTYNKLLLSGYANSYSGGGTEVLSLSNINYSVYDLIVYFSSDTAGRTGTVSLGSLTFDFSTIGQPAVQDVSGNAILTQTTDTTGANPSADYAIFSDLSGSAQTVNFLIPNGGGISAFQIVAVPEPGTLALAGLSGLGLLIWRRQMVKL